MKAIEQRLNMTSIEHIKYAVLVLVLDSKKKAVMYLKIQANKYR